MSTTLTVAAVDQTAKIAWGSLTCKLNTLDCTLVDPATRPAIGDAAVLTEPTWSGTVTAVETADPVDRAGHVLVKVTATNTVAAGTASSGSVKLINPRSLPRMMYSLVNGVASSSSIVPDSRSRVMAIAAEFTPIATR